MNAKTRLVFSGGHKPRLPEPGGRLPLAIAFPGEARAALSALGWQAVYRLAWQSPRFATQRFFLSARNAAPRSEETSSPLDAFPLAAFSLGYELDGAVLTQALIASGIPLLASQRSGYPILLGGGPLAFLNPAPLSPVLDAWFVGEAEAGLLPGLEAAAAMILGGAAKKDVVGHLSGCPGFYVPGMSLLPVMRAVARGAAGLPPGAYPSGIWPGEACPGPLHEAALPGAASGRILDDPAYSCFVSHEAEFKDTLLLEVNRGCPHSCRFCAAGFVYRPPRQAALGELQSIVTAASPKKVGLVGTALTDWPCLAEFLSWLSQRKTKFTLSSVRADAITPEFLGTLRNAGLRTLTLALEGPSARIRAKANKNLDEETFLRAVELAAERGVNHLKTYLIAGWPGERDADYLELSRFLAEVCRAGRVGGGKRGIGHLTLGVNPLVPKPFTPMQWAPMASQEALEARLEELAAMAKPLRGVRVEGEKPFWARVQGLFARGGEDLAGLYILAGEHGWRGALKRWEGDMAWVLDRERGRGEIFPWEVIDVGVGREALWREWGRYASGKATPKCPDAPCGRCLACGGATDAGESGTDGPQPS